MHPTCVEIKLLRRVRAASPRRPPRHQRDSCPSDEVVGGFIFDFGAVRTPRCSAQAISILELSLKNACLRRDICEEDLDMVRDQIITVEVNIARVFNHDVVRRRQAKGEVEA